MSGADPEPELREWQKDLFQEEIVVPQAPAPAPVPVQALDPLAQISLYLIVTFFACAALLVFTRPAFVTRTEATKPYETPSLNYGTIFLISFLLTSTVGALIWCDRSEVGNVVSPT